MDKIDSVQNSKVKAWTKLQMRKERERAGLFLIDGLHLVEEAIKSGAQIEAVLHTSQISIPDDIEQSLTEKKAARFEVSDAVMRKLSDTKSPQGIVAVVETEVASYDDILKKQGFLLLLDEIQDPGNLGTIIRVADAAGIDGIILGTGTVDQYNAKVLRSTMGSIFHIPIIEGDLLLIMEQLKQAGYTMIGATLEDATQYDQPIYDGAIGLVIGSEATGISERILDHCTKRVKIPIYGQAESLNASVAAGILIYEGVKQRRAVAP